MGTVGRTEAELALMHALLKAGGSQRVETPSKAILFPLDVHVTPTIWTSCSCHRIPGVLTTTSKPVVSLVRWGGGAVSEEPGWPVQAPCVQ